MDSPKDLNIANFPRLWGAFHGLIITLTHSLGKLAIFKSFGESKSFYITAFKWLFTFYLILIGWVFFRAENMQVALGILTNMHSLSPEIEIGNNAKLIFLFVFIWLWLVHIMDYFVIKSASALESKPWLFWLLMILGQSICLFIGEPSNEFIYFQF